MNWKLAALTLAVVACGGKTVDGDGRLVEDARTVGDFRRVRIEASLQAEVTPGEKSVSLLLDENLRAQVLTTVVGDTLVVASPAGVDVRPTGGARVTIQVPQLDGVEVSGTASATAQLNATNAVLVASGDAVLTANVGTAMTVSVENTGDGKVTVDGAAPTQTIDASGSGETVSTVNAESVALRASGAVSVRLRASRKVSGEASGDCVVTVAGQPAERDVDTSGTARVLFE